MRARVDLREIPQPLGEGLAVHQEDIELAVLDRRPGGQFHASSHGIAVGGHDADEEPGLFRAVVEREPDGAVRIAQGGRERGQSEPEEAAELLVAALDLLDDPPADPGLAFVDKVAFDGPAAAVRERRPADIDPADAPAGDPGALGVEAGRQAEALGESVARSGIDEAQLRPSTRHPGRLHQAVDDLLDGPVAPHGDDQLDPPEGRLPGCRGRVLGPLGHEERESPAEVAFHSGQDLALTTARPPRGGGRVDDDDGLLIAHAAPPPDIPDDIDLAEATRRVVREVSRTCQETALPPLGREAGLKYAPRNGLCH